jgi:hypothetical protein
MADESCSRSESISWRKTTDGDVQRMIGKEELGATGDLAEAEAGAARFESIALAPEIGGQAVFAVH